jgi:UDP-4-amino-4,6-dideoxy-N-acetyl-beta-L-altrosamine transaminase
VIIPYSRQSIEAADIDAVVAALKSEFLTQGPTIPRFEERFAEVHGGGQAVAVCNATAALHIGCLALGVGPGDRVWTSPNSFVASANCALYCDAEPDFVDIDPATRNMSVDALAAKLELAEAAGTLPKVVVPVDFAGLPCDLADIRALADRYGFAILEDASHAVGATYRGAPIGSAHADITVFSFHPVKIITTGEGGLCLTRSEEMAQRLRLLRSHGITREPRLMRGLPEGSWYYEQVALGLNYRLTDIQAALGTAQLSRLTELHARRQALARRYDQLLADLPLLLPARSGDRVSSHHLYVVEIDERRADRGRDEVFAAMRSGGIGVNVHYIPIHLQPFYRDRGFMPGDFPASEAYYRRAITLPLFPAMTETEQDMVVERLKEALEE